MFIYVRFGLPAPLNINMKAKEIYQEMTMRAGSYEGLSRYAYLFTPLVKTGQHVGDIERYHVHKDSQVDNYGAFDNDDLIAFWQMDGNVLETVYVMPEYRRQGMFAAILWFMKRNEGLRRIILGDHHSNDTYYAMQRIFHRFNAYWQRGQEKIPYSPDTLEQFYSLRGPTGWRLVLENNSTALSESRYFNPMDLGTWYFNLLD